MPIFILVEKVVLLVRIKSALIIISFPTRTINKAPPKCDISLFDMRFFEPKSSGGGGGGGHEGPPS